MENEKRRYLAYMVRLWQVNDAGQPAWRASLEDPHTGERRGFADLDTLFTFLKDRTISNTGLVNGHTAKGGHIRKEEKPGSEPGDRQDHGGVGDPSEDPA